MSRITLMVALISFALLLPSVRGQYEDKTINGAGEEADTAIGLQPFFMGSRYGRSEPKASRKLRLAPRNDRFFMGSRYGKRDRPDKTEEGTLCEILDGPELMTLPQQADLDKHHAQIACVYTGMNNLYRCYNRVKIGDGPF